MDIEELRRREFPITRTWSYLNHSGRGPLPVSHLSAVEAALRAQAEDPYVESYASTIEKLNEARGKAARLMHCEAADVAFLGNTAQGLNLVAQGLDWRVGDQVVTLANEFPNVVVPWVNLADKGVKIEFVPWRESRVDVDDLISAIGPRTRVVALSLVNFRHGFRFPAEEIRDFCRQRGVWIVLDGIHALGALELDALKLGADVLIAHSYKYLLGGFGISICYCSPRTRQELRVPNPGWFSRSDVTDVGGLFDYFAPFSSDAHRFESSTPSLTGLHGLCASLNLLLDYDQREREKRLLGLGEYLRRSFDAKGWRVTSSARSSERSGIVTAELKEVTDERLIQALSARRVAAAVRDGLLIVSPHFYNTTDDCDRLFQCLDDVAGRR